MKARKVSYHSVERYNNRRSESHLSTVSRRIGEWTKYASYAVAPKVSHQLLQHRHTAAVCDNAFSSAGRTSGLIVLAP